MSDFEFLIGGLVSAFAVGFIIGRSVKMYRQFLDAI